MSKLGNFGLPTFLVACCGFFGSSAFANDPPARAPEKPTGPGPFLYSCESAAGKAHLIYRGDVVEWAFNGRFGMHIHNPRAEECVESELTGRVQNFVIKGIKDQILVLILDSAAADGAAKITVRQILDNKKVCQDKIEFDCTKEASPANPARAGSNSTDS